MKNGFLSFTSALAALACMIVASPSRAQEATTPAPAAAADAAAAQPATPDAASTNAAPAVTTPTPAPEPAPASTAEVAKVTLPEEPPAVIPPVAETPWGDISIGTRMIYFRLMKENKQTFLGNINRLEEKQDMAPDRLYVNWYPTRYAGAELTWDKARATTHNQNSETGQGDGDFVFSGPILTLMFRYPNETGFTPYGGIGMAFLNCSFENDAWWYYGWPSPEAYEAAGSPSEFRNGYKREITVENANAFVIAAGCDYRLDSHWLAEFYVRYMSLDLDAHYVHGDSTLDPSTSHTTKIPFDNVALGVGIRYTF